jgi:hypothetical protein
MVRRARCLTRYAKRWEWNSTFPVERLLAIRNAEQRIQDLKAMVASTLKAGTLGRNEALLMLRGRLGFRRLIPTWTFGVAGSQTIV